LTIGSEQARHRGAPSVGRVNENCGASNARTLGGKPYGTPM
jgi:hypothetical protein